MTTAGKHDKDMEVGFYTDIWFDLPTCPGPDINPGFAQSKSNLRLFIKLQCLFSYLGCENGCDKEVPQPGMSYIEFDINKDTTDILGIYRYLASKVNRNFETIFDDAYKSTLFESSPLEAYDNLFAYFGQDLVQVDPQQIENSLAIGGDIPILTQEEKVCLFSI